MCACVQNWPKSRVNSMHSNHLFLIMLNLRTICINYFQIKFSSYSFVLNSLRPNDICVGKLAIIGSDNDLSPGWRQAIIWTNVGILLIGPLGINLSEVLIRSHTFSFKKMHLKMPSANQNSSILKMPSAKWHPLCLSLNALMHRDLFD